MKKIILLLFILVYSCEDNANNNDVVNDNLNLIFIASEGSYGDSDGSITVFNNNEKIQTVENIGDVVHSILVHEDKLFVIVNNSHLIKRYSITETGLSLPGIEIDTDNSSPRAVSYTHLTLPTIYSV